MRIKKRLDFYVLKATTKKWIYCYFIVLPFLLQGQSDSLATCQTKSLFQQLKKLSTQHLLFGHQNTTLEGLGWEDISGLQDRSDCLESVGDYPAIYGFDFTRGFHFRNHVRRAYERGAIITFSDHQDNYVTGGNSWDTSNEVVAAILDDKTAAHRRFLAHLDQVASFFRTLRDQNGEYIPVIYRPFHENSGDWFWWSMPYCTAEEFVQLWQFTIDYFRITKNIHHVLYAYSPSDPAFRGGYEVYYPGDAYVDVAGFDSYATIIYDMFVVASSRFVVEFATAHNKIPALTEFGVNGGIQFAKEENWFMDVFLNPLKNDSIAHQIAYAHTWRNASSGHHWVPLPESLTHNSFVDFYKDDFTLFERDLPDLYNCDSLDETTSIEDLEEGEKEQAYSLVLNSTLVHDFLEIKLNREAGLSGFELYIFDSLGRLVKQNYMLNTHYRMDVSNLSQGTYFIKLIHKTKMADCMAKFVKI